jgi:hypothetical protein
MSRKYTAQAGLVVGLLGCLTLFASAQAPPAPQPELMLPNPEVLEQGPIHEAFAEPLALDQQQPEIVAKQPPEPVQEIPPAERPKGTNVVWIPGYFMWDQERADFIWVSGLWRDVPPKREWIPGEWQQVPGGWQWVHGFWAEAGEDPMALLPVPPATLEEGPSSPAPGDDFLWAPGTWVWLNAGYAWQAGSWYQAQPNWVWVPSHFTYTPRGVFFVSGYWDYPPVSRAVLYAPVYWSGGFGGFGSACYYQPVSVINTSLLVTNLFVHYGHHHYYFGYGYGGYPRWLTPWGYRFAHWGYHHGSHYVYDPWWSYYRWHDRHDFDHGGHWKYQKHWEQGQHNMGGDHFADHKGGPQGDPGPKTDRMVLRSADEIHKTIKDAPTMQRLSEADVNKFRKAADRYRNFDRNRLVDTTSLENTKAGSLDTHSGAEGTTPILRQGDGSSDRLIQGAADLNQRMNRRLSSRGPKATGEPNTEANNLFNTGPTISRHSRAATDILQRQHNSGASEGGSLSRSRLQMSRETQRRILEQQTTDSGSHTLDSWSGNNQRMSVGRTRVNSGNATPTGRAIIQDSENLQLQHRQFPRAIPLEGSLSGNTLQRTMRFPTTQNAGPQINNSWQGNFSTQNRQTYTLPQGNFRAGQIPQQNQTRILQGPQRIQSTPNFSGGQIRSGGFLQGGGGNASGSEGGSDRGGGGRRSR